MTRRHAGSGGAVCIAVLLSACSGGGAKGSGGASASSGGTASSGGASSTGGAVGSGGIEAASGGAGGSASGGGGSSGSGGVSNNGGTPATGGVNPSGGSVGAGGSMSSSGGASGGIVVALDRPKQTMDGLGIGNVFQPTPLTAVQADALFDPKTGIGLSILRIGMDVNGGALTDGGVTYGDAQLAAQRGVKTFMATVIGAPATCKTNNNEKDGGHLLDRCYDTFATAITKFTTKVKTEASIELTAMSIANTPDFASCGATKPCNGSFTTMLYTADEMVKFLKVVGPKLHTANPSIKVIAPEVMEWLHLWSNKSAAGSSDPLGGVDYDYGHALARDADAWTQLDILGVQQFDTQVAELWPNDVPAVKPLWVTEMAGTKFWPEEGPSSTIDNGVAVAGWIHDAIVNGNASAWLYMGYKPRGGTDDNSGLILQSGADTKRHYTLGNFSRFVRPGYSRVDVTGNSNPDVLLSAFKSSDGVVVIVAINRGNASVAVPIAISGGAAPASMGPWVTSATDNLAAKTVVPLTGGSFTAMLAGQTVTTYVGK